MPSSPVLVLIDLRAMRRTAVRQRLLSLAFGVVVLGASAAPLALLSAR